MVLGGLLQPNYRVRAARSGFQALRAALSEPGPDLILLDVMMPDMDGHEVMRSLARDTRTSDIPVIFLTAMDSAEDEQAGLDLGAVDYITKPFNPAIVLARVRTQLEIKRARDILQNQNAMLEAEVARRMQENQFVQDATIHVLARLAEIRDPETGNHLRRTQEYVRILANRLRSHPRFSEFLSDRAVALLVKSAPLHDIGKVGIPDPILLKPGPLDPAEWEIMKTHARLGYDAIVQAEHDAERPIEFLSFAKQIARHHHERWDGRGYPDGLAGEQISLPARLMALADVFDALISWRVYKAPMHPAKAREIIEMERGRQFDPDMVDAFLAGYDEFLEIARRYHDAEFVSEMRSGIPGEAA